MKDNADYIGQETSLFKESTDYFDFETQSLFQQENSLNWSNFSHGYLQQDDTSKLDFSDSMGSLFSAEIRYDHQDKKMRLWDVIGSEIQQIKLGESEGLADSRFQCSSI